MIKLRLLSLLSIALLWAQQDSVPTYVIDTVRIQAMQAKLSTLSEQNTDKVVRLAPGTQLVYRSVPFAQEVVYQGLLPTQTQVTIDGMRLLPACVDRMDPVLTFVEAIAIEGASWQTTTNWGATPTLNLHLFSPDGPQAGQATLLFGDNYHRVYFTARDRRRIGQRLTTASALTFRLGGDYRVGRRFAPGVRYEGPLAWAQDTTLRLPDFRKINFYTALRYRLSDAHHLEASYMGDFFYNVAYPALIMDSRHSAMHMVSLRHIWKDFSDLRLYANSVFHDMTDETRPESEIRNRIVMPGMYMPMKGITRTAGAVWSLNWWEKGGLYLSQRSEYSFSTAYGSMDMFLIGGGAPMRLLNLADIRMQQGGTALTLGYRRGLWHAQAEGRWNLFSFSVGDTIGYLPLRLYQEAYSGGSASHRAFSVYQVALSASWTKAEHTLTLNLSTGTRAPTHTELYAYYLYVPMDNSILMGSSTLQPERLLRGEVAYTFARSRWSAYLSAFGNRMANYISPVTFLPAGAPGNSTLQQWRILRNTGTAYTAGFSAQATLHLLDSGLLEIWSGYTYGWHKTLGEPLPWIYPLYGRLRYTHHYGRHQAGAEIYAAAAQRHLARTIYIEDYTPAYWLLHLRYGYRLWQKGEQTGLHLTVSAENVLNTYGWDHLSVGNMPFLGRVLRVGLWGTW